MAAQQSRKLLGCFVLVHYSESLKDLTQAGHPPAAELAWGWELLQSRAGSCVLAGAAISSQLPMDTFWRLRKRGGEMVWYLMGANMKFYQTVSWLSCLRGVTEMLKLQKSEEMCR